MRPDTPPAPAGAVELCSEHGTFRVARLTFAPSGALAFVIPNPRLTPWATRLPPHPGLNATESCNQRSALLALGRMRVPGVARLRLDVGEAGAGWRAGNADEMLATGALNLPARVARVAFQRLVAVGTVEFEFVHSLHPFMRKAASKSMWRNVNTFCPPIAHVEADEPITYAICPGT